MAVSTSSTPIRIRLGFLLDESAYLGLMQTLADLLVQTGEVDPVFILCRDLAEDPPNDFPYRWRRLEERNPNAPQGQYDYTDITRYERFVAIVPMGDYFEGRHDEAAQSICAAAECVLSAEGINCVVTWSGTRLSVRAAAAVARAQGIPVVTLESPYFPRLPEAPEQEVSSSLHKLTFSTLIWDTRQAPQCGPSQLSRDWRKAVTHPELSKFLDALRTTRTSKFSQDDIRSKMKAHLRSEEPIDVSLFKPPATKALLVLGQTDHDSSMCFGDHLVRSWRELGVALARRLPKGWLLWFKGHPLEVKFSREMERFAQELHDINPHCRLLPPTMDVHACYAACDAVACINSTATIEAALYEIPVLNLGVGSFTHIGISTAIKDLDSLESTIAALPPRMTPEQIAIRDQFLSYVLYEYLIPVGSPVKMLARLRQAMTEAEHSLTAKASPDSTD